MAPAVHTAAFGSYSPYVVEVEVLGRWYLGRFRHCGTEDSVQSGDFDEGTAVHDRYLKTLEEPLDSVRWLECYEGWGQP